MGFDAFSKYHPAVNFIFFIGAIVAGMLILHPAYVVACIICSALYYVLLRGRKAWSKIAVMLPLFVFVSLINPIFNTYGERVITHIFGRPYTLEALLYGAALAGMLVSMLLWFGCYNAVLTEDKFTSLFSDLAPSISLLLVMVLRLIPSLIKKGKQIAGARMSIGKDSSNASGFKGKLIGGMTLVSALLSIALEGGVVTADSMRARGYGCAKRTSFMKYRLTAADKVLLALIIVLLALIIFFSVRGAAAAEFTPELNIAPVSGVNALGFVFYCVYMLLPSILHIREDVQWNISRSRI